MGKGIIMHIIIVIFGNWVEGRGVRGVWGGRGVRVDVVWCAWARSLVWGGGVVVGGVVGSGGGDGGGAGGGVSEGGDVCKGLAEGWYRQGGGCAREHGCDVLGVRVGMMGGEGAGLLGGRRAAGVLWGSVYNC